MDVLNVILSGFSKNLSFFSVKFLWFSDKEAFFGTGFRSF